MHLQGRKKIYDYAKESIEFNYLYIFSHRAQKENIRLVIYKSNILKLICVCVCVCVCVCTLSVCLSVCL